MIYLHDEITIKVTGSDGVVRDTTRTAKEWCAITGMKWSTVRDRVTRGYTPADAVTKSLGRGGFVSMTPERRREISSMGGKASHALGTGHEWDKEAARVAGRLGGLASHGGRGKQG